MTQDTNDSIMTLNGYANAAMTFRMSSASPMYAILNLAGEVGELHSLIAKGLRDGPLVDFDENLKKELGDCLWSIAAIALDNGFSLREVAQANIDKLSKRKANSTIQGSGDDR
jgi:NTP pyrophosphatase (non-canonical NTP hydrolase)